MSDSKVKFEKYSELMNANSASNLIIENSKSRIKKLKQKIK